MTEINYTTFTINFTRGFKLHTEAHLPLISGILVASKWMSTVKLSSKIIFPELFFTVCS